MSLDFPATGQALWSLYDQTGIRPEYLLPVLYSESGYNPAIVNSLGYTGINQASAQMLSGYGLDSATYAAMPASEQITRVVTPEYKGIVARYGVLHSGARVYLANFLPATLPLITTLDGVLAHEGNTNEWGAGNVYGSNSGFDTAKKGTITLQDLANAVSKAASSATVQNAIAQTYALRPGETPQDPVYGTDFGFASKVGLTPQRVVLLGAAGFLAWTWYTGDLERFWNRSVRPALRKVPAIRVFA